jgi:hypothetical protein
MQRQSHLQNEMRQNKIRMEGDNLKGLMGHNPHGDN